MIGIRLGLGFASAALAAALALTPVAAQAPELAMLDRLERGQWELRLRSDGSRSRICVRSGRELIQIRHRQPGCERFVVQDDPNEVTVQYTCRGNGYGRTTIRREGAGLVQVRSRGIEGGRPFSVEGEARRVGSC
ncbi:hypothetical protein BMF35_a0816 [Aurantiacibacter gangjinensis]|uniref:Uncharacterized protein n=2 Tax=Aurantiacibacter gangjinensis TaxID=502682 RepID=A0A0G9MNE8_9SPHN|nr:DUF3617 family protein [Aurantiacibacter gangjinensis]APE27645.1 hypothetical protein BMF35_a0816 [Aurantiacibacter gangjinensis]KLE32225.1 hypothetical protein AAW01_09080 [Aurantiacibacter gangjinensis]